MQSLTPEPDTTPTSQAYRANGKLLLTSEYLVLDGALALAIPTRFGQTLEVRPLDGAVLKWEALEADGSVWLSVEFSLEDFEVMNLLEGPTEAVDRLRQLLLLCRELMESQDARESGQSLKTTEKFCHTGTHAISRIEFDRSWGLGSSSTLVQLLAEWSGADAFDLQQAVFGGSGYDIACADATGPILYKLVEGRPVSQEVDFDPPFAQQLYFVHLGRKQDSREGIAAFAKARERNNAKAYLNTMIHSTIAISRADRLQDFEQHLRKHEEIISAYMGMQPVKQQRFADFWGQVKSLGAWGGDFVLATSDRSKEETLTYFAEKGFETILSWDEMILPRLDGDAAAERTEGEIL